MRNLKNISILLLLIILTVGVVFIPQFISGQREEKLLNEIVYRDYNAGYRPKLTDKEVARLYHDRKIDINLHLLQGSTADNDAEKIQEDVVYLTELLFSKETAMCEPIGAILENNALSCFRSSSLILVDNQPTALNFVSCGVKGNDVVFEILYEEKTKTIIGFLVDSPDHTFNSNEEMDLHVAMIESLINSYFEEQLHLNRDEYYCSVEFSANSAIRCGILQLNEKAMHE